MRQTLSQLKKTKLKQSGVRTQRARTQGWYQSRRWRKKRLRQLDHEPLCRTCAADDKTVPARIADHIVDHHGNPDAFWNNELQSLCASCHSRKTRATYSD